MKESGVYKFNCYECNASYIGQTGCSFINRIKEHKKAYIDGNIGTSSFANYLIDEIHTSEFKPDILHIEKEGLKLTTYESLEISREPTVVNEFLDICKSPLIDLILLKTT